MEKIHINDLDQWINEKKSKVERHMIKSRSSEKLIRTRERDKDEQKIMDRLCMKKWKKAEQEGKIKYLSKRKWYYDVD